MKLRAQTNPGWVHPQRFLVAPNAGAEYSVHRLGQRLHVDIQTARQGVAMVRAQRRGLLPEELQLENRTSWKTTCRTFAVSGCQSPLEAPRSAYWKDPQEPDSE